jgi:hypothetical protein
MTEPDRVTANPRATTFVGRSAGSMRVVSHTTISGPPIACADGVDMIAGIERDLRDNAVWAFHGVATNDRYTTREEKAELTSKQSPIGRPEASWAALILLRKKAEWWALTQDERRSIFETDSHHIAIGMRYLPAIARRLLHCRDLDIEAPFDFLGFLDFAPESTCAFDDMLGQLRATREWSFMDREIDIRLVKAGR